MTESNNNYKTFKSTSLVFMTPVSGESQQAEETIAQSTFLIPSKDEMMEFLRSVGVETAPKDFPDGTTSGFVAEMFKCGRSIYAHKFLELPKPIPTVPSNLSIYGFSNSVEGLNQIHKMHSVIIQLKDHVETDLSVMEFFEFLVQKEHFENLQNLMFVSIPTGMEFMYMLRRLKFKVLGLRAFAGTDLDKKLGFRVSLGGLNSLEKFYVTHPSLPAFVYNVPIKFKKALVYCPKSSESSGLNATFILDLCNTKSLKLIKVNADSDFKHTLKLYCFFNYLIDKVIWNVPCKANIYLTLMIPGYDKFLKDIHLKCPKAMLFENYDTLKCWPLDQNDHHGKELYSLDEKKIPVDSHCLCGKSTNFSKLTR